MFNTDFIVAGLAPYGNDLVALAYVEDDDPASEKRGGGATGAGAARRPERPELHILTLRNKEIASDALTVRGFERCRAGDYHLEYLAGENFFYIISPSDIVVAKPCDLDDHITWLQQRGRFEEACAAAEGKEAQLRTHDIMVRRSRVPRHARRR